ncbi:MAG: trigger factor, partial [Lachnospiraceae bacterium]|nr:trigger factor [Lachnospiraceae bacterium]
HEKSLAGKEATFKCHINSIKEKKLPELNDEFASDVSEFDTLEEYKKDLKEKLAKRKEESAKAQKENEAVAALILDSEIELPEAMVTTQARRMLDDFGRQLQMQGLNLQSYLQYTGSSADQMLTQIRPQAIERIKSRLCLEAVAAAEKIEATEEDVENKLKDIASQYHMEVEKLKETMQESDKEQIKKDLAVEKAAQFLVDHAKEVKQKKDKKEAGKGKEASAEEKKEQGAE